MKSFKKLQTILSVFIALFLFVSPAVAAAPDGIGPAADSVFSSSQGLKKNGSAVLPIRSDPTTALGVAENDTIDGHFYSLGFGGNIVLGFDNGISTGTIVVESTELFYPGETARVEMSENGTTWVMAGNVTQDGTVNKPEGLGCARYVRITDTSNPTNFPDDTADGYDVDGVIATGDPCGQPTATPTPTIAPTIAPTTAPSTPSNPGGPGDGLSDGRSDGRSSSPQTTTTTTGGSRVPGFPNTGTCSSNNPLVPCFPNTGIGPNEINLPLVIFAGALLLFVTFYLTRRAINFHQSDEKN